MKDAVALWHAEHAKFSRLLDTIQNLLADSRAGAPIDHEWLRDIVSYLHRYGHALHHPREDIGFAHLLTKAPELAETIARLEAEHTRIFTDGEALEARLEQVVAGALVSREAIEVLAYGYIDLQREHLAIEEDVIIPRIAQTFDATDWALVGARIDEQVNQAHPGLEEHFMRLSRHISSTAAANR